MKQTPDMALGRRSLLVLLSALALLAACGGGGDGGSDGASGSTSSSSKASEPVGSEADDPFVAQVASYELVAGQDQRFLAALAGNGTGLVVSFGKVDLEFFYLGTRGKPIDPPQPKAQAEALFFPVAGQTVDPNAPGPRVAKPSEGLGVYAAPARFDAPGFWGVKVKATIDGKAVSANAAFEVVGESQLPFPGQPAPRTENPISGAEGVEPTAIDSRAKGGQAAPDPKLHSTSVASALASGKPTVVVVSTPVYCVSQFCGPITDSAAKLADKFDGRVNFVHLEVWKDFEKKLVNPAAAEWISPRNGVGNTQEPWIFLVGADGLVKERFDNVISDAAFEATVTALAAG